MNLEKKNTKGAALLHLHGNAKPAFKIPLFPENLETQQLAALLDLRLRKTCTGKSRDYHNFTVKLRFQNVCCPHYNAKRTFSV